LRLKERRRRRRRRRKKRWLGIFTTAVVK